MVEYCLGNESTPMGALRHADGHPYTYWPYAWEIGNEQVRTRESTWGGVTPLAPPASLS